MGVTAKHELRKRYIDRHTKVPYVSGMKLPRGFSFSLSRALGIDVFKRRIARKTGIPLTRAGRQRKIGRIFGMK